LRFRRACIGGTPKQLGGTREVLRELLSFEMEQPEVIDGGGMPELRRGGQMLDGSGEIARTASPAEMQHGERKARRRVAALGRKDEPFGGLLVVLRYAGAVAVELAEKRHRLGVAVFAGKARRLGERRRVKAALIGRESSRQ
jgi:hypothetical protein